MNNSDKYNSALSPAYDDRTEDKAKVLVVDDIPANIVAVEQVLRPLDIRIVTAQSGKEAISHLLRDTRYALILLDVQMPEMDGFETAELIRQDADSALIPIIFVTAISKEDKYLFKGYKSGAVDYLFKPIDDEVLLSKVKIFVDLYQQQQRINVALKDVERAEYTKHLLLDNVGDGIIGLDKQFKINFINKSACLLLDIGSEEALGESVKPFVCSDESAQSESEWLKSEFCCGIQQGGTYTSEGATMYARSGKHFRSEYNLVAIKENDGITGSVLLFRDVTDKVLAQEKLLHLAQYDQLTGLANRMLFWNFLGKTLANARRHGESFALLYIDLDEFKQVNDTLGHLAGDLLLTKSAERLLATVREGDMVARLGGDEFAVVVTHVESPEVVGDLASRIIEALVKNFRLVDESVQISASVGIAMYPGHGEEVKEFTSNADTAMYEAKKKGKNTYQFFSSDMQRSAEAYLSLAKDMELAIVNNEFDFSVDLWTSGESTVPFAIRPRLIWNVLGHSEQDYATLLQIAATARCGNTLEEYLLTALRDYLRNNDFSATTKVIFDLPLSPHQIKKRYLTEQFLPEVSKLSISKNQVVVMLSEELLQKQARVLLEEAQTLARHGIEVGICNFGSSNTNMVQLAELKPHFIQVDKSVLLGMSDMERKPTFDIVLGMAGALDAQLVATDENEAALFCSLTKVSKAQVITQAKNAG